MEKDLFASKTTWAAIVYFAVPVLNHFGIKVDPSMLTSELMQIASGALFLWGMFSKNRAPVTSVGGVVAGLKKNQGASQ
jgi:hypothetical protein